MADDDERARMRAERERRAAAAEARMRGLPPPALSSGVATAEAPPRPKPEAAAPAPAAAEAAPSSTRAAAATPSAAPLAHRAPQAPRALAVTAPGASLGGVMVRRVVPSDNSCLFAALGYVTRRSRACARELREAAAAAVAADPFTFNEGFLGKANDEVRAKLGLPLGGCRQAIPDVLPRPPAAPLLAPSHSPSPAAPGNAPTRAR